MAKIKDGEQAFPHDGQIDYTKSMTLRDYFAAKAMQGLLSNKHMGDAALHGSAQEWLKEISETAYEFADAMLAERENGG